MYNDQRTDDVTLNIPGGRELNGLSYPMRVVLITASGMYTMLLPEDRSGHFRFQDENGLDADIPLYVEAAGGHWIAFCEGDSYLLQWGSEERTRQILLTDKMVARIPVKNDEMLLYVEAERPGDRSFFPYYLEERTDYTIGRSKTQLICYPNDTVSREHALLHWENGAWYIQDMNSLNGVFVNGKRVQYTRLKNGDSIFIMGLYILVGSGFMAMNNANDRVLIKTPRIRRILNEKDVYYPPCLPVFTDQNTFDRQPRKLIKIPAEAIDIDMPPMQLSANKIPLLLRMGSPMVMGGRAIATGNILMALTSLVFPALTQGLTEKDRKEYDSKRSLRYREYLQQKTEEITQECRTEEKLLNENYPPLSAALRFATSRQRLWERRRSDEDFLSIRLGSGSIPMLAEKRYTERKFEMEPDPLAEEMYKLAEREELLQNAPVMLNLMEDRFIGVYGDSAAAARLFRGLILQIALTHSYDEAKIVLLGNREQLSRLDFVRYLPHCWDDERTIRFFAASQSDAQQIGSFLSKELEALVTDENPEKLVKDKPSYVIFALDKKLFDAMEILKSVLHNEKYCGVSLFAAFQGAPKECSKILDLRDGYKIIDLMHPEEEDLAFLVDESDRNIAHDGIRELMRTKLKLGSSLYEMPNTVTFLEMYAAGMVEHLNPLKRWRENNPVKSLSAPVGVGTDGKLFTLDLHEKRQGPHGLVAGMTGSGKSEFLITYILSMAVNYSPDEVAFILIDYKGGGLADAFEDKTRGIHLPHLVGTITNLDGAAIQRSLMSINSELKRRQAVFKRAKSETGEGTMDIYDYQKLYRAHRVSEPLPHLFIISDEFAELKSQQPEFMDELISTARIGRSLGVHLILATQKPGGVVNNQIWSNTRFRVCLKVQDREDSIEMLKRPEAAELKQTGRFYLQVGYNEYFAMGQSAWCGAEYFPQEGPPVEVDNSVQFIDRVGQTTLHVKPRTGLRTSDGKQITAIVKYLSDLAKKEEIKSRPLWVEPLSPKLELASFLRSVTPPQDGGIYAAVGMADDPEYQTQFPFLLNFAAFHNMMLIGSGGSGKSAFLQTVLLSLMENLSPQELNYYILDLSNGALRAFGDTPHCGAYLTDENENDFIRLIELIKDIISERRKLFIDEGVSTYDAYRQLRKLPLILVMIDGFIGVKSFSQAFEIFNDLGSLMRDGSNYGIRFILTGNLLDDISTKLKSEIDVRVALQAKDRYAYSDILSVRCPSAPPAYPGRGIFLQDGRPLEYQTAMLNCEADEQRAGILLQEHLQRLADRYEGCEPARSLPMIQPEQPYEEFLADFSAGGIPLGYSQTDMRKVSVPFQQLYALSCYFGNPLGVWPVFENLLLAAEKNGMKVVVVKRVEDSVFGPESERLLRRLPAGCQVLDCTADDLEVLDDLIVAEVTARNVFRDEFCVQHGIPSTDRNRAKKAGRYIRANSVPLLVIFESFGDLCRLEKKEGQTEEFSLFFERMRGYNIYFVGGFYPTDAEGVKRTPLMNSFNPDELLLFFGGRYDKQCMTDLPMDYRRIDKMAVQYNRFMLKYRDEYFPMIMPCGELITAPADPEEAAII